nr:YggS family pyridoxal phosphate-dependent enzyme [bacterium]
CEFQHIQAQDSSSLGIAERFKETRNRIEKIALNSGRNPDSISIIAVSKTKPVELVYKAIKVGITNFGENRLQEAEKKIPAIEKIFSRECSESPKIIWHMIGRIQSNKTSKIARLFDVVHSIDNIKNARRIAQTAIELGKIIDVFIEVNTTDEEAKGGIAPELLLDFAEEVCQMDGLRLRGLMTLGPHVEDDAMIRRSFANLRLQRDELKNNYSSDKFPGDLSMGMSGDYPIAIEEGSTHVRIGTALFGKRQV